MITHCVRKTKQQNKCFRTFTLENELKSNNKLTTIDQKDPAISFEVRKHMMAYKKIYPMLYCIYISGIL